MIALILVTLGVFVGLGGLGFLGSLNFRTKSERSRNARLNWELLQSQRKRNDLHL